MTVQIEKWIAELNPHEMALRIAEAACQIRRPPGKSAEEALAEMRKHDEFAVAGFYRAALAAAKYLEEAVNNFSRVN